MVWNLSVSYDEHQLIGWIMHEAVVSVSAPLEWVLVSIRGEKVDRYQWPGRGWLSRNG